MLRLSRPKPKPKGTDSQKPFYYRYKIPILIVFVLANTIIFDRSDLQDIYRGLQLHKAVSHSSTKYENVEGPTADNQTYEFSVPVDFRELSDKEALGGVGYLKSYKHTKIASILLSDLGTLAPDEEAAYTDAHTSPADIVKAFKKTGNRTLAEAQFDRSFRQTAPGKLAIDFKDDDFQNSDLINGGTFVFLVKNHELYQLSVQSLKLYDKTNPGFREEVVRSFVVK